MLKFVKSSALTLSFGSGSRHFFLFRLLVYVHKGSIRLFSCKVRENRKKESRTLPISAAVITNRSFFLQASAPKFEKF